MDSRTPGFGTDEFDLLLLEAVLQNPGISFKELARLFGLDQRTVAKRMKKLTGEGVLKQSIEIDWAKLGFAQAMVGSTTAKGIGYARKMSEFVNTDPRIVEAYETLGTNQYFMKIIETDTYRMRDTVIRELDVLAAELTTSLVTKRVKRDYRSFIRYLRETRYPGSRARGSAIP
jgi:DNA-binding Lrp family transcriptional regulator